MPACRGSSMGCKATRTGRNFDKRGKPPNWGPEEAFSMPAGTNTRDY